MVQRSRDPLKNWDNDPVWPGILNATSREMYHEVLQQLTGNLGISRAGFLYLENGQCLEGGLSWVGNTLDGKLKYIGVMRRREPLLCTMGQVALYLLFWIQQQ
jgi:hypothetical protein